MHGRRWVLLTMMLAWPGAGCSQHRVVPSGVDAPAVGTTPAASASTPAASASTPAASASTPAASASTPLFGPDERAVCRAMDPADAVNDKWARFGDIIPISGGGLLYVLDGRSSDAEAAIAPFGLRYTTTIECSPSGVVLWIPGVDLESGSRAKEALSEAFARQGLHVRDATGFTMSEGESWRRRVCQDPAACCRLLQLHCRFRARTEAEVHACVREGKKHKQLKVDPSCR